VTAAPEAAAALGGAASSSSSSSMVSSVPSALWYGNVAASTVHGAYISVPAPPSAAVVSGADESFEVTATFAPPAGAFSWAVVAGTAGVVASGTTVSPASPSAPALAVVRVTEEMAPAATLLVFAAYDGKGGEAVNVVAAQVSFQVASAADKALTLPQSLTVAVGRCTLNSVDP
jgi:hypothetical protein